MKTTLKPILAFALFLATLQFSFAHTTNEQVFSKALTAYDNVIKLNTKIFGKDKDSKNEKADKKTKITREIYKEFKVALDDAIELFDQYLRTSSNYKHKKVARLYLLSLKKIDFTATGDLGLYLSNFKKIKSLNSELQVIKGYSFPLRYKRDGKNYIIKSIARKTLERQLLIQFTETSAFSHNRVEAAKWAKKAYYFYNYGDYNLWWTAHMWYHNYDKSYKRGVKMVTAAEKLIYAMSGLKRSDVEHIVDNNYANYTHAYRKLNIILKDKPELSRNGEVWAKAADNFDKLDKDAWATEYYNKALDAGYGNKTFLLKMMKRGKNKGDKTLVRTSAKIFDAKNLYSIGYSCSDYSTLAEYFSYVGEEYKATELQKKYKKCNKKLTKQRRRRARGGKFFVSFAPLAPLSKNLQGSIQIGGNRRLHEFGIKQTRNQRDFGFDVLNGEDNPEDFRWDGLSYYYTYKKFFSKSDGVDYYFGLQLRYTDRDYTEQRAKIRNKTSSSTSTVGFNPAETRYDFTIQPGLIYSTRFFHIEYYAGFGIGYSIFDGGRTEWNNNDFEITNHNILANRETSRIGATFRLGLVMGLNFINKQ